MSAWIWRWKLSAGNGWRIANMGIDPNNLPQDAATLRCLVASLLEDRDTQERRIRQLQHMLEQLLRARYGPRRDQVNENQLFLFAAAIVGTETLAA